MSRPDYKPVSDPEAVFTIFAEKCEYEQLPVYDPEHEYCVIRTKSLFVPIAFKDYDSVVKYINEHYPEAEACPNPFRFHGEEENDIQITSMLDITIQQCWITDNLCPGI